MSLFLGKVCQNVNRVIIIIIKYIKEEESQGGEEGTCFLWKKSLTPGASLYLRKVRRWEEEDGGGGVVLLRILL